MQQTARITGRTKTMVNKRQIKYKIDENGCWLCTSHIWKNRRGYPRVERDGKTTTMSRYIYEKFKGKIPEGLFVLHNCDNPECINPDHLRVGTNQDNMDDMVIKKRNPTGIDKKGHKLTEEQVRYVFNSKEGARELGRKFNISHSQIVRIRQGKIWRKFLKDNNLSSGGGLPLSIKD